MALEPATRQQRRSLIAGALTEPDQALAVEPGEVALG
jgi:hypothetical protein